MHRFVIQTMVTLLLLMLQTSLHAQKVSEDKLKAVFLYNFSRFVNWPAESFATPQSPFVIGIIGNDPFGSNLADAVEGESVNGHPIEIKYYTNDQEIDCHILYINFRDPDMIRKTTSTISQKNILTVSDHANFLKWGGMVRFFNEKNRIRLQINAAAAKEAKLDISSKLLSVAQIY